MPFKNHSQEAACRAQAERDVAAGYTPRWNCDDYKNGAEPSYHKAWIPLTKKELIVYKGERGGRYRIVNGESFYATSFQTPKPSTPQVIVGARGGRYTQAANGKKVYIKK